MSDQPEAAANPAPKGSREQIEQAPQGATAESEAATSAPAEAPAEAELLEDGELATPAEGAAAVDGAAPDDKPKDPAPDETHQTAEEPVTEEASPAADPEVQHAAEHPEPEVSVAQGDVLPEEVVSIKAEETPVKHKAVNTPPPPADPSEVEVEDEEEDEVGETPTTEEAEAAELEQELAEDDAEQTEDAPAPEQELEALVHPGEVAKEAIGTGTDPNAAPEADVDPHAPSPDNGLQTSHYDQDATATVKFVLMPSGQVATLRCHLGQTLRELREHFSNELKMPANVLILLFDGRSMNDATTLGDLGVGPNGTVRLEMQSADPIHAPMKPFRPRQEYHMPDVITVRVPTGFSPLTAEPTGYMDVVVEIERNMRKKPFLGGYRHKETGIEYHHASAQTMQKVRTGSLVEKFCRDTQTSQQCHVFQQTTNDTSTQMTKIGVYVSNMSDILVTPGKYTTADEFRSRILGNVILIQKYYRRWLARRYVEKVRLDKSRRQEWEREEETRKKQEKEERIKREFERRMNPKTKEDFDLLYHALEKWRQEEVGRINADLMGAERKAALCQLLEQETQLIASVGRHKLEADGENHKLIVQKFLDKAASPKRWRGPDGKMTEMDTPYTIRAQQMRDIYNSINMKYLTQDERLDVLLTLKHTVKEHDCKLTQEIIELIDREADLLMRGVKETNLDGLRKRISTLFLQYIKTPTFNPEAARLIKVPQDPSMLRRNIYFCASCNQYLPSTEFQLSSNSRAVGMCRNCSKTDNDARVRQDYSHYRYLLKNLRRQEDAYGDDSKIAFLLQENDLRHLVENVWNSQSILSAWDDLYDLTLVRWIRTEEWSPWNCILLTKEEASAHEKLENLEEAYGKVFIHRVKHKHTLARNYFSRLPGMAEHMRARAASSTLSARQGPSVSGKSLSAMQPAPIKAQ